MNKKRNWKVYYRAYQSKGGGSFLWKNLLKLVITLVLFILLLSLIEYLLPETIKNLDAKINEYHPSLIFLLFFLSESFLGLLPPDLFIIWTQKLSQPYLGITLLALFSYLGGFVSYQIGIRLSHWKRIEDWLERQLINNVVLIKRWGSVMIVMAALFPLPFSPICIAAGSLRFPIKPFLAFSAFRIARFYLYALILFRLF